MKHFQGKEGTAAQGDLYLGKKKIAFWSQDANGCIEDSLDMELGYSEHRLRQAIIAAHPEKHEEKIAMNGKSYTVDYELESLMADLLGLMESEKAWKRAVKAGYAGLFEMTDGFHVSQWKLPEDLRDKARTAEDAKALISKKSLDQAKANMFENWKIQEKIFWNKEDFEVGQSLRIEELVINK